MREKVNMRVVETFNDGEYLSIKNNGFKEITKITRYRLLILSANIHERIKGENKENFCKLYVSLIQTLMEDELYDRALNHYSNVEQIYPKCIGDIANNVIKACYSCYSNKSASDTRKAFYYRIHAYFNFMVNKDSEDYKPDADIKRLSDSLSIKKYTVTYKLRSYVHYYKKEYINALADVNGLISLDKNAANSYLIRTMIYFNLGKKYYTKAMEDYNTAVKNNHSFVKRYKETDCDKESHGRLLPIDDDLYATLQALLLPLIAKLAPDSVLSSENKLSPSEVKFIQKNEDILEATLFPDKSGSNISYDSETLKRIEGRVLAAYNSKNIFKFCVRIPFESKSLQEKFKKIHARPKISIPKTGSMDNFAL